MTASSWLELGRDAGSELKGGGTDKVRGRKAVNLFCSWATEKGVPFPLPIEQRAQTRADFITTLEAYRAANGQLNKDGSAAVAWADELMKRSIKPEAEVEAALGAVEPPQAEDDMAKTPDDVEDDLDDNELDEDEIDDDEVEEEEEAPKQKRQRRNVATGGQQPVIVNLPASALRGAGQRVSRAEPREPRNRASKLFPNTREMVRIYKRTESGRRELIDDYAVEDFGDMNLEQFINEVVHPRFGDDAPFTDYIAYQLAANGAERSGVPIRIEEDRPQQPQAADPFGPVRQAAALVRELKGEEPKVRDPAMALLKERAASSGDMNGVMMMMMLEKVFAKGGNSDTDLLRVALERLDRIERGATPIPPPQPLPPWMMQPPAPSASEKVMDLAMAKLAQPPPNIFEQAKELATLRELFGGAKESPEVAALKAEVASLRGMLAGGGGGRKDGLSDAMETFERVTTMVKSFAPQVAGEQAGSGFGGFIKGLFTPDVGKAIAQAVAGAANGAQQQAAQQQPQQPAQPQQQPRQQQVGPGAPPPPRDMNRPPNPPPAAVVDAARNFAAAMTPPMRAEKFADYIFAMFLSGDGYYQRMLEPVIADLNKDPIGVDDLKNARRLGMMLVAELKPDWATPEFIDTCISALASKAQAPIPQALVDSRGAWTLDFRGNVLMLSSVARPVVTPAPAPTPELPAQVTPELAVPSGPPKDFPTPIPAAQPLSEAPPERVKRAIELEEEKTPPAEVIAATTPAELPDAPRR